MRLLFISTSLPPFPDSATIRSAFLIRGLAQHGWRVVAAGPRYSSGDDSLSRLLPQCCQRLYTSPPAYDRWLPKLGAVPVLGRRLRWMSSVAASFLLAPDVRVGWDRLAVRACAELMDSDERPDIIVSSSGSCTAHMAGSELSCRRGIPWIADVTDPWALVNREPFNVPHVQAINHRLEKATLAQASTLVFTTPETMHAYHKKFGDAVPMACIPCGYSDEEFADALPMPRSARLTVTYVGVAYGMNRNLRPLIEAIAALNRGEPRFRLQIVGPHSTKFEAAAGRAGLSDAEFSGYVPYARSIECMAGSHILFIVGNGGPLQVPGKVYMYLGSGRPILYVGQRRPESDPTYKVLREFPGVTCARQDAADVARALEDLYAAYETWQHRAWQRRGSASLRRFEWNSLSAEFGALCENLVRTPAGAPA